MGRGSAGGSEGNRCGRLALTTQKAEREDSIPLDDDLLDELLAWRQETPYAENSDYIFASPKMKGKQPG